MKKLPEVLLPKKLAAMRLQMLVAKYGAEKVTGEEFTKQFIGEVVRVYKNQNQNHE